MDAMVYESSRARVTWKSTSTASSANAGFSRDRYLQVWHAPRRPASLDGRAEAVRTIRRVLSVGTCGSYETLISMLEKTSTNDEFFNAERLGNITKRTAIRPFHEPFWQKRHFSPHAGDFCGKKS
jgi:hypothetical protein